MSSLRLPIFQNSVETSAAKFFKYYFKFSKVGVPTKCEAVGKKGADSNRCSATKIPRRDEQ